MAPEKRVATPEAFHRSYAEAFNSGDVGLLVSLYEQGAVLVPQPGQVVSGRDAIREALGQYLAVGKMTAETRYCVTSGDVALASASWQVSGTGPDGRPVAVQGTSADVLRRQADGRWLLVYLACPGAVSCPESGGYSSSSSVVRGASGSCSSRDCR